MDAALIYSPELASYDLGPQHPLRPERVTLSVELMDAYGLLRSEERPDAPVQVLAPDPATRADLLLAHSAEYVEAVRVASFDPTRRNTRFGLGTGDNPVVAGMHEVSALITGGAVLGLAEVLAGRFQRTFNVAGGLHHAHRDRAAGFCVYNDPAVAIARALHEHPGLRVAYLDIDGHHGDGVQEAFYANPDVLTISIHESGRFLFPGTGYPFDMGEGSGHGYSLNLPMPPYADDECYAQAFDAAVEPALRAYRPDVIVAQCGADAHHADPLTHLALTLGGYRDLVRRIVALADDVCDGRLAACGGGGYAWATVVPRAWTCVAAELAGAALEEALPERWRARCEQVAGETAPTTLTSEDTFENSERIRRELRRVMEGMLAEVRRSSPLLRVRE